MDEPIALTEYEDWTGGLSDDEAQYITSELAGLFSLRREPLQPTFVLNPHQHVGVVVLPSGRRLESHPKVPVRNVFYMLAVASDFLTPFREEISQFDRLEQVLEFVADYFAGLVEDRVTHGLYRSYVDAEENLPVLKGRIDFARDLRENVILRNRTYCRFADFTWDIPENQIVRQVAHLLSGWDFRPELRMRLGRLDNFLGEVSATDYRSSIVDRFSYHRLNDDYRSLHQFCRLFLEGASLSEHVGPFDFRTFLVDMNKLYELFLTKVLEDRVFGGILVSSQDPMHLDYGQKVVMQPDIVIRKEGVVRVIADCKYKRAYPEEFRNHDVYQVLAYCTAAGVAEGVLIYPRTEVDVTERISIRNSNVTVRRITIDIGGDLDDLEEACDALATTVLNLS